MDLHATVLNLGVVRVVNGLEFKLPLASAQISRVRVQNGVVKGYFYVVALDSEMRFPLPEFMVGVLADYAQLVPNSWRILTAFYIGCRRILAYPTSRIFRLFYSLKKREGWYCFQARGTHDCRFVNQ